MSNTPVVLTSKNTVNVVANAVRKYQEHGEIDLPQNYAVENALKSAWLKLQEVKDRNGKQALSVCTQESTVNTLLSMVVQGLNPDKNQCYFIVYGNQLTLQRSYFGSIAVAKRVDPNIEDIFAEVVYKDDSFAYEKKRGRIIITEHTQKLENINKNNIIAAYCTVLYKDGREDSKIMTMEQIEAAWSMSKTGQNVHKKFTEEMCKRTVINRACKMIINASDDSNLMARYAKQTDVASEKADMKQEISDKANGDIIDGEFSEMQDEQPACLGDSEVSVDESAGEVSDIEYEQQNIMTEAVPY